MAETEAQNLDLARKRLAEWLHAKWPEARGLEVESLVRPGASGFSNETLIAELAYRLGGRPCNERGVIRLEPSGFPVFPFYDLRKQYEVMRILGEKTDIPVPRMRWREENPEVLGRGFYVMDYVEGQVPADNPPYPVEGFVCDATPEQRRLLWESGLETMARIHRLDWRALGLDFLDWPGRDKTPIEQHLDFYESFLEWGRCGRPQPTAQAALEWLRSHLPSDEPEAISWGDARIGNMIFRDFRPVAVLDWEMVTIGNPETDLGWWLFLDEFHMRGGGMPGMARPRLEGLPSHEQTVAQWEELVGRKARSLFFYKVFAGFRFACIMVRLMQQQVAVGRFPEELGLVLERNNPVTQQLAELLELPPPQ